jgi:hypothetical protein
MIRRMPVHPELPFPKRPLKVGGGVVQEYIIPEEKKEEVLRQLYIFIPIPSLDDEMYDLHEEKKFKVREFRVTREGGMNMLVSPYYPESGGSVIDWVPAEEWEEE